MASILGQAQNLRPLEFFRSIFIPVLRIKAGPAADPAERLGFGEVHDGEPGVRADEKAVGKGKEAQGRPASQALS